MAEISEGRKEGRNHLIHLVFLLESRWPSGAQSFCLDPCSQKKKKKNRLKCRSYKAEVCLQQQFNLSLHEKNIVIAYLLRIYFERSRKRYTEKIIHIIRTHLHTYSVTSAQRPVHTYTHLRQDTHIRADIKIHKVLSEFVFSCFLSFFLVAFFFKF